MAVMLCEDFHIRTLNLGLLTDNEKERSPIQDYALAIQNQFKLSSHP